MKNAQTDEKEAMLSPLQIILREARTHVHIL